MLKGFRRSFCLIYRHILHVHRIHKLWVKLYYSSDKSVPLFCFPFRLEYSIPRQSPTQNATGLEYSKCDKAVLETEVDFLKES